MTDRNDLDKPAAVTAFALGVVLILVSVSLFAFTGGGGGGGTSYLVSFTETDCCSDSTTVNGNSGTDTRTVEVDGRRVSNVTVSIDATDTRPGNLMVVPAVQCTWTLSRGGEQLASGNTCDVDERVNVTASPELGEVTADSSGAAMRKVWERVGDGNETSTYTLQYTWSRGALPGGVQPPQGTAFSATVTLQVDEWSARLTERDAEVPR